MYCVCFRIALLTIDEWNTLLKCYDADYEVYVYFSEQGTFIKSKPGIIYFN